MKELKLNDLKVMANVADTRIIAGIKNGEIKAVVDCGGCFEYRWSLDKCGKEVQEAVRNIVEEVGVCRIFCSYWTDWKTDGPCDISVEKCGEAVAWIRIDPDGAVYDYLSKEVIETTTWPIGWDALRRLEELGYDTSYYQHVREDGDGFSWTVQLIDPKDETTLWEIDLINNQIRHRGQERGCFWTEWEER